MHEKLNTLPVAQLRERAKAAGIKGISSLKKAELIERLCAVSDASEQTEAAPEKTAGKHMPSRRPKAPVRRQKPVSQETPASEPERLVFTAQLRCISGGRLPPLQKWKKYL